VKQSVTEPLSPRHAASHRPKRRTSPAHDEIEAELAAVRERREKPAGTIRITATECAIDTILLPNLAPLLCDYPDIKVEMIVDYGLTEIVAQQYDAGVRSEEQVAKEMIAVRIGPDKRAAVVGAPPYFIAHAVLDSRWVKFELKDYREVEGQFDRIVSVGMFQRVGPRQTARITSCGGSREAR
jgi:DNA-binding transcriptional LysR family regulator